MKREIRNMLVTMSALAITLSTTTFFTGCNKKNNDSIDNVETTDVYETTQAIDETMPRVTPVDDSNNKLLSEKRVQVDRATNAYSFVFRMNESKISELLSENNLTDYGSSLFDKHKIYKKDDDSYYVFNRYSLVELVNNGNDNFTLIGNNDGYSFLTNENGKNSLVFDNKESYDKFVDYLKSKLDEKKDEVPTIVNGIFVGVSIENKTVDTYDGTRKYYDLKAVLDACSEAIKEYGYLDKISYVVNQDGSYDVTRTSYDDDEATDTTISVPVGDKGIVYYDSVVNYTIGMSFVEDGKTWICNDALLAILGIDVADGEYTIPETNYTYKSLMIDTGAGEDEPEFIVQDNYNNDINNIDTTESIDTQVESDTTESTEDNNDNSDNVTVVIVTDEEVDFEPDDSDAYSSIDYDSPEYIEANYDRGVYEDIGEKIVFRGTIEEQVNQLYEVVHNKYPGLPIENTGLGLFMSLKDKRDESDELINRIIKNNEDRQPYFDAFENWRAGRNPEDVDPQEIYDNYSVCDIAWTLGDETANAFIQRLAKVVPKKTWNDNIKYVILE